jgi:hypothetical protein
MGTENIKHQLYFLKGSVRIFPGARFQIRQSTTSVAFR